ncbi:PLP-dependent cysteine synthase family protein [Prosthecomicrobium sp. N25]|uniref:PLP-dependent cysteine synthase family protein n=1 Tax=Prosthecomicrobium sp. N25 TaxID=3129254 RepID=UPI003076AAF6
MTARGTDRAADRRFAERAIGAIEADFARSADTHLIRVPLPAFPDQDLYLKDESTHVTGSLKHRLARSLFLHAFANGWLGEGTTVVEASSGSTAVSEAYFARLVGLPFVAVMPRSTAGEKIEAIRFQGGDCRFVDRPDELYAAAAAIAEETGGHYMDQFTQAERATDWRGNNNIAESIFTQMRAERHPVPDWIVVGAGTGGTSATIGRYLRYRRLPTLLALADPESSVFHRFVLRGEGTLPPGTPPCLVEGIGRPRVEPSFMPKLIDRAEAVADVESIAAARLLSGILGRRVGGSTGTNFVAALRILAGMRRAGRGGSVVSLLCDSGERYRTTYYDDGWVAARGLDLAGATAAVERAMAE